MAHTEGLLTAAFRDIYFIHSLIQTKLKKLDLKNNFRSKKYRIPFEMIDRKFLCVVESSLQFGIAFDITHSML